MSDQGKLMRQLGELFENGHVDEVDGLLPEGVRYHLAGFPDLDRAGLKEFIAGFHQSFPDSRSPSRKTSSTATVLRTAGVVRDVLRVRRSPPR